jgi:hypothetical protein
MGLLLIIILFLSANRKSISPILRFYEGELWGFRGLRVTFTKLIILIVENR